MKNNDWKESLKIQPEKVNTSTSNVEVLLDRELFPDSENSDFNRTYYAKTSSKGEVLFDEELYQEFKKSEGIRTYYRSFETER